MTASGSRTGEFGGIGIDRFASWRPVHALARRSVPASRAASTLTLRARTEVPQLPLR